MWHRFDEIIARNRPLAQYIWSGSSSLIVDNEGVTGDLKIGGFYFRQTRYLSKLEFRIDGERPFLCSAAQVAPNELEFSYIFPPVTAAVGEGAGGGSGSGGSPSRYGILTRTLDLRLSYRLHPASCDLDLVITNRWDENAEFEIQCFVDADYAGVPEILGKRMQEAGVRQSTRGRQLILHYEHDQLPFQTTITSRDSVDWRIAERRLTATINAPRQKQVIASLQILAEDYEDPLTNDDRAVRESRLQQWLAAAATLHAAAETPIVSITNRAVRDLGSLALLEGTAEEWMYPGAGVPLYLNVWGRDALTTGWQAGAFDRCEILRNVLLHLGRLQGTQIDDDTEEQPGRILNREEPTPTSRLGIQPFRRFYGDFASPFMFIISLGQFFAWTADKETLRRHWQAACRVIDWARHDGDSDGDGYLEYVKHSKQGPKHQGWKDSENAVVYDDGRQVEPPIAPAEVQAYYYASLQFMAILGLFLGEVRLARKFWRDSVALKKRFNRDFWMDDEGFLAFGLDSQKRQIRTVASNAGHCLATGIIDDDKIPRVVERLFASDMFSGWGIRTMTSRNPAYNPLDYHLGSIWTVENGTMLFGLRRYGFDNRVIQLARALYDLAMLWPGGRIPECVGGYGRGEYAHPGAYPQANAPQAWNQSIWVILMQSLLGLQPAASFHSLGVDPILPEWLPEVTLRNLQVGDAKVTIRFWRDASGRSHYHVVEKSGTLHVLRQQPINAMRVHWWSRLRALASRS